MGLFETLKSKFGTGKLKKEQIERLRQSIWTAVADGVIDDRELEYINGFYASSELSHEDFQRLRSEIFRSIIEQTVADKRMTDLELKMLNHLLERLEISPDVETWAQEKIGYYIEMHRIESGAPLTVGNPSGLLLKKNEVGHLCLPSSMLEERVVARNYAGGSRGVSIRIVKGVRYRIGSQRGQMTSQTGMVTVSDGYLVITNQRIVFSGDRKTVSTPLKKLIDFNLFADAVSFSVEGRQKPIIASLSRSEEAEMCGVLVSRLLNELD
jgi:hypothetical protein